MSIPTDHSFRLLTSFTLPLEVFEDGTLEPNLAAFPTLDLHLSRLEKGHQTLAAAIPESWCAKEPPINPNSIIDCLNSEIKLHQGTVQQRRFRMTVGPLHSIELTTSPLSPNPNVELLVTIDNGPTFYEGNPFLLTKTTFRKHYDDIRLRNDATYHPVKGEIFDVLMYNHLRQITETTISNVAIKKKSNSSSKVENADDNIWITPHLSCGLLNGVRRQFLLSQSKMVEGIIQLDDLINKGLENWEMICFNEVRGVYNVNLLNLCSKNQL